jgi:RHS repeat-associated protein
VSEVQYFWGLDLSGSLQGAGGVGGLLAVSHNGQFYFPTFDNNGNVTKYIDESGNAVAAYEYDDFGRIMLQSGSLSDFFRHRFSTKYYDTETGIYYYGYRFYTPDWRTWLNRDPLEENGGSNLYGFCDNNPIVFVDTLGEHITITEDNLIVRDRISTTSRAVFIPMVYVSFSCSWNGVLHMEGKASRRIEILTPNMPSWNQRKRRYNDKWGKDRSNAKEWSAAYAHEMDHWNSFNALFAFLHLLNDFDGKNLCNKCNEMKDELKRQYNTLWNSSLQHSERYDSDKYNYGGAYPKAK